MVYVKICGIRRFEDIDAVNRLLPEYVGFVFAESRRRVSPDLVKALTGRLDAGVRTVGVFVNEDMDLVLETAKNCRLDVVQLHGDEPPGYVSCLSELVKAQGSRLEVWKAIRVKDAESVKSLVSYHADAFLLDAYSSKGYGGAGRPFDWSLAENISEYGRIILAGGLSASVVREAVQAVRPFAVDVSSGVETDGFKDENKIREFINRVRGN